MSHSLLQVMDYEGFSNHYLNSRLKERDILTYADSSELTSEVNLLQLNQHIIKYNYISHDIAIYARPETMGSSCTKYTTTITGCTRYKSIFFLQEENAIYASARIPLYFITRWPKCYMEMKGPNHELSSAYATKSMAVREGYQTRPVTTTRNWEIRMGTWDNL